MSARASQTRQPWHILAKEGSSMLSAQLKPASRIMIELLFIVGIAFVAAVGLPGFAAEADNRPPRRPLRVEPLSISSDKSVRYDYDIVYVRAPRFVKAKDGKIHPALVWHDANEPHNIREPTDLMHLHPDGSEEVLVEGSTGAIADPYVSFDAQWVYYTYYHDTSGHGGADVYKIHVPTRKIVRLTRQE